MPAGPAPAHTAAAAHDRRAPALTEAGHHDGHGVMAGCVVILLGLFVAAALRRLGSGTRPTGPRTPSRRCIASAAARAPPPPLFLSLCVFRI
ncbi:hypothetical protein [Pseudonocardia nigra]|uniref:hypothetical protein n=1 Tax=Pseudonocardia nigra TaxID=1921578 RepID=UPI001C5DB00E|nr:hypothetical protein [Pseudonocardia nigra]